MSEVAEVRGRIEAIDLLRGMAVLGILLLNIQSFSTIESAYFNPTAYGDFSGVNAWVWGFTRLFADQKFMTLFSVLFGAGVILMSERALAAGRKPGWAHYRRMALLLGVGLLHAYLLWYGDILTFYALCGMLVYVARRWRPRVLLGLGLALLVVPFLIFAAIQYFLPEFPPDVRREFEQSWSPDAEAVEKELSDYRGSYGEQLRHRARTAFEMHFFLLFIWFGWRVTGLMMIGMALFKWRVLGAYRSVGFYRRLFVLGCVTGLLLEGAGMIYQARMDWAVEAMIPGMQFNYWASLFVAMGYLGAVMLWHQAGTGRWMRDKLSKVGRMAFTNYLAQTVICTTIFYGHGFGLFGLVERWQQLLLVVAIWVVQFAWSAWWLRRFQYGPLEWLWRCATYMRLLPFRVTPEGATEVRVPPILR
jgi:uncharacterized protein